MVVNIQKSRYKQDIITSKKDKKIKKIKNVHQKFWLLGNRIENFAWSNNNNNLNNI